MRTLTDKELREYKKTFDFLNNYIGVAYYLQDCESMFDILINEKPLPDEIKEYIKKEHNSKLLNVHTSFNESTTEHKNKTMQNLIRYCNTNRVQPSKLRVIGIKDFRIKEKIQVETISFK